jgi:2-phosphosulfolactate phosphatase
MPCAVEVLFTPAEYRSLRQRDVSKSHCVVFDVLRATSVIVTALANGAESVVPVEEISEALQLRLRHPEVLLCGERNGMRIEKGMSSGVEFDLGNSPYEYTRERIGGRTIVTTTTNGTRALRACNAAKSVIAASFLNMSAAVEFVISHNPERLLLVCAGTGEATALEDVLCAGAFCEMLSETPFPPTMDDSAEIARRAYRDSMHDLPAAVGFSRNARRLMANSALHNDVEFCLRWNRFHLVPVLGKDGMFRKPV